MSEVRNIPILRFPEFHENWGFDQLNSVTKVYDGTHQTPKYVDEGVPFYSVETVTSNDFSITKYISEKVYEKEIQRVRIELNDILMTRIGDIGTSKLVTWDKPCSFYVSLALIKKSKRHVSGFLKFLFDSNFFQSQLWQKTLHVAYPKKINLGELNTCKVLTPSIPEQQKIADFLTAVDKRIELLEKKKTLLETYKKGVMKKIFNQEIRFKDDNGIDFPDWEEKKLGDITNKKSSNISANSIEQIEGDYIVYGATGELKKIDFYEMDRPYISIVKDGSGVGRVNVCKPFSSVLGTLDILTNNESSDLDFVFQFLSKTSFLKYVTGSSIPHIYYKDYSKLKMLVPTVEEQVKISEFLSSIDNQIELLETQIDKSKTWKKGLLQKMFV